MSQIEKLEKLQAACAAADAKMKAALDKAYPKGSYVNVFLSRAQRVASYGEVIGTKGCAWGEVYVWLVKPGRHGKRKTCRVHFTRIA